MVDRYLGELDAPAPADDADGAASGAPHHVGPGVTA
jgi:hypothetical protein